MKFKFRNLLIGTGIALLGVAAVGAAVGITEKKSDKPDTSDTTTENLDLINLIGDLQNQIDTVSEENEKLSNKANQLSNSLNALQTENTTLKNQLNTMFDTNINVNGDITANKGNFDSIQVGNTEFIESNLNRNTYRYTFNLTQVDNLTNTIDKNSNLAYFGDNFGKLYATLWIYYIDSSIYLTYDELQEIKTWSDIVSTFGINSNYDYPMIVYKGCYASTSNLDDTPKFYEAGISSAGSNYNGGICISAIFDDANYISYHLMFECNSGSQLYSFNNFKSDFDNAFVYVTDSYIVE